jgi:hypothetical protein
VIAPAISLRAVLSYATQVVVADSSERHWDSRNPHEYKLLFLCRPENYKRTCRWACANPLRRTVPSINLSDETSRAMSGRRTQRAAMPACRPHAKWLAPSVNLKRHGTSETQSSAGNQQALLLHYEHDLVEMLVAVSAGGWQAFGGPYSTSRQNLLGL